MGCSPNLGHIGANARSFRPHAGFTPYPEVGFQLLFESFRLNRTLTPMTLTSVVLTLIVVGVLLWLVNTFIPMDGKIKQILNAVVVIAVIVWLLYGFGVIGGSGDINLPKIK